MITPVGIFRINLTFPIASIQRYIHSNAGRHSIQDKQNYSPNLLYLYNTQYNPRSKTHTRKCSRRNDEYKSGDVYPLDQEPTRTRGYYIHARNYIKKSHLSSPLPLFLSISRVRETTTPSAALRWIISTDRTCARYFNACRNDPSARRAASRHKVSPSFPYLPPSLPHTSASFAPPALAHHHGPLTRELSTRDLSIGFSHS